MAKLRFGKKKIHSPIQHGAPLTLNAANGTLQRTFDAEIVDHFRRMTTDLICTGGLPRRIVVTSAIHGEGVTYTVLALATTLASDTADRFWVKRAALFIRLNDMVVKDNAVIPLITRPRARGANLKLVSTLSGWDLDFSTLQNWYRET